jgi:hypothetical protein
VAEIVGGIDYARLYGRLVDALARHLDFLELAQTAVIELSLTVPASPGTYDVIFEPEDGKVWYLGYIEVTPGANTSVDAYVRSSDGGPEVLVLSAPAGGAAAARDFKLDYGASARCLSLRVRTSNSGTSPENINVVIRGIETVKTI